MKMSEVKPGYGDNVGYVPLQVFPAIEGQIGTEMPMEAYRVIELHKSTITV